MVLSDETPGARWICISTFAAVLSSIFLIFILPFSLAFIIDSINEEVVFPKGTSVTTNVLLSRFSIFARTFTVPPLNPSLYLLKSAIPPVGKSGSSSKSIFFRYAIEASISSIKLCGNSFDASPTAIPSTPCASKRGNLTGSVTGSFLRPSYESFHSVVFGLKSTSSANFDNRASIYLGAAAPSPVKIFPQFPCVSISKSF